MSDRKSTKLKYDTTVRLPSGSTFTPQSLAFISEDNRVIVCSGSSSNNFLKCSASGCTKKGKHANVGHGNGATYCPKNKLIYVTAYEGNSNSNKIRALDPSTYSLKFTVTLPTSASGIAYDRITNQFYVSTSSTVYVYSYEALAQSGKYSGSYVSKFSIKFRDDSRSAQDVGGHNGVAMVCRSYTSTVKGANQTSYIDCYNASNGKYLGSFHSDYGELESVSIDNNNYMHILFAQDRKLVKTKTKFAFAGSVAASPSSNPLSTIATTAITVYNGQNVVAKAESFLGQDGTAFWKYGGLARPQPWCACFVWCIVDMCGIPECCYPKGTYYVPTCHKWLSDNDAFIEIYKKGTSKNSLAGALPGDIVIFNNDSHIGFVREAHTSSSVYTVEGNHGSKVANVTRKASEIISVFRPPYGNYTASSTGTTGLFASPEKLYSSDNFEFVGFQLHNEDSEVVKNSKDKISKLIDDWSKVYNTPIQDTPKVTEVLVSGYLDKSKLEKTKISGEVFGPTFPIALNPVEAPFIELTIGDYTFGTVDKGKLDRYPNYINGLNVTRTNGSMNEYTINLVHQIRPGDNPNFIDELLSKNSYDKITIKYGDANSQVIFTDSNALLIGATVSFDFVSCRISYTLKATSSCISVASHKRTFASTTEQPSNIIRELLYNDTSGDLLNAFPRMRDKNFVETNNLIPSTDTAVEIEEFKNVTVVTYLKNLVSAMKSITNDVINSTYMLTLEDGYFRISELSNSYVYDAPLYEVDVNFPDNNQVFSFNVDTNYTWPIAYDYSGNVSNYNYEILNNGQIKTYSTNSSNLTDYTSPMQRNLNENWWTQVTEFPISAKLTCRGLLSPLLLLTYVKINCLYYGSQRINSGVYIVTGQEDSLDGGGYRTTLTLLRVAGPKQHITVDGRIKT